MTGRQQQWPNDPRPNGSLEPGLLDAGTNLQLPVPEPGREAAEAFVATHLSDLCREFGPDGEQAVVSSPSIRGGQRAADEALAALNLCGYSSARNNAYPVAARGASGLSPYVRHGMIDLGRLWAASEERRNAGVPEIDVNRYQTELLWQEYSRHCYAAKPRLASRPKPQKKIGASSEPVAGPAWDESMGCLELATHELQDDGWLVGMARMWLSSDWANRQGGDWRQGEDYFFAHLLDGSRAANRAGWATVAGLAGRDPYLYSRWDVELRAPGLCASCERVADCPVERPYDGAVVHRPARPERAAIADGRPPERLAADEHLDVHARDYSNGYGGPFQPERPEGSERRPEAVWITAESMGDADPALAANPDLPVVFVFDRPLLRKLRLSSKRLVFLTETLADLATRRHVNVWLGRPAEVLTNFDVSVTWTPVPGWRRLARQVRPVETHPWPWLHQPISSADLGRIVDQVTADTGVDGFEVGLAAGFSKWCERVADVSPEQVVSTAIPTVIGDLTSAGNVS